MASGLPVLCSDIGAFAERLENRPASWQADWRSTSGQWLDRLLQLREEFAETDQQLRWDHQSRSTFDYTRDYLSGLDMVDATTQQRILDWDHLTQHWQPELPAARRLHQRLFRILLWMQIHPWLGRLADLIPMTMRRSIKRKLTTRPLHE